MSRVLFIDPGHGGTLGNGLNLTINNDPKYITYPNYTFYEGDWNREVANMVQIVGTGRGIRVVNLCPTPLDISLSNRVSIANILIKSYGADQCIGLSIHSNKGGGEGFEIYAKSSTSIKYAESFYKKFHTTFPSIRMRTNRDGGMVKNSDFYMLRKTLCPWIYPEFLFYDNPKEVEILRSKSFKEELAKMIVQYIIDLD